MNDSPKSLLIADDDEDDLFFILTALENAGVQNPIKVVPDGSAAIDYLAGVGPYADREKYPFPALMLLDLKMPVLNGFEVLAWLQNAPHRPLQTIVLSGSALPADMDKAQSLGADAYRVKAFDYASSLAFARELRSCWLPPQPAQPASPGQQL